MNYFSKSALINFIKLLTKILEAAIATTK